MPAYNERFGVRRGVGSWDTLQVFESSVPVLTFAQPRPTAKPQGVSRHPWATVWRKPQGTATLNLRN